jgi:predicted CXXCH cytochrome family protein
VKNLKFKRTIMIAGLVATTAVVFIISCATVKRTLLPPPAIAGAEYVGVETCALCHEKIVRDFKYTDHGRIEIQGEGERVAGHGCEACHGAGSLHMEAGGGRGNFIVNPGRDPEACFQCHLEKKALFNLQYHHPVEEKRMSCTACHNPHGEDIFKRKGMFVARENETCLQCHREQARPHVFEHEALREGCTTCHNAHGSINEKLLVERDNNLCLKCHAQLAAPGTVTIGDVSHTPRLMQGTCWSAGCHTAVHGSNINPHLRY